MMTEKAIANINTQMEAILAILANGRSMNGNAFDYNNLATTKERLEKLLAAQPSKKK